MNKKDKRLLKAVALATAFQIFGTFVYLSEAGNLHMWVAVAEISIREALLRDYWAIAFQSGALYVGLPK